MPTGFPEPDLPGLGGRHVDFPAGSRMSVLRLVGLVHGAVEPRGLPRFIPAQLGNGLGEAGPASFLEALHPDAGGV